MTTRGGGVGDPKVSPKMTGELWFALAIGLSALAWHALHWWVLVIPAACLFAALVQRGQRVQAERQELVDRLAANPQVVKGLRDIAGARSDDDRVA